MDTLSILATIGLVRGLRGYLLEEKIFELRMSGIAQVQILKASEGYMLKVMPIMIHHFDNKSNRVIHTGDPGTTGSRLILWSAVSDFSSIRIPVDPLVR